MAHHTGAMAAASPPSPSTTAPTSAHPWDGCSGSLNRAIDLLRTLPVDDQTANEIAIEGLGQAAVTTTSPGHDAWRVQCMRRLLRCAYAQGVDVAPFINDAVTRAHRGPFRTWYSDPSARPLLAILPARLRDAGLGRAAAVLGDNDATEEQRAAADSYMNWALTLDADAAVS
jgi:hypothetical protein